MPATGKTSFAEWLSKEMCIKLLSLDEVWDEVWEEAGTSSIPFSQYWTLCEDVMKSSSPLIMEFGFDNEIIPTIDGLVKKYNYRTVNVHFDTSFEIAHRRFNDRRLHVMGGSKPQISLEQYINIGKHDKDFCFGSDRIYVDTTDFSSVSYLQIQQGLLSLV